MMNKKSRRTFSPEFRLESAQLVVDEKYSIREAATAVGVGHSTMDKWVRQLRDERQGVTPTQTAMTPECPSSNKWDKASLRLSECFAHQFHVTRRVVDSANGVSRWFFV